MAAPALVLAAILAFVGGLRAAAETDGPTPLERQLQGRYLDHYYLLRADVQVIVREAKTGVSMTYPTKPPGETIHPNTVVTPGGIFYARDFSQSVQMVTDVRVGVFVDGGQPGAGGNQADVIDYGGTVGNVVDLSQAPQVVYHKGDLIRVVGVEESGLGVQFTVEGFRGTVVPVFFRSDSAEPPPDGFYEGLFQKLCFELPEDREERLKWMDPGWPEEIVQAIQQERVVEGMTPFQVLLSWGTPVHVSQQGEGTDLRIWLYSRGTIRQQLQGGGTNVYFAAGKVVEIGGASLPGAGP